MRKVTHIYARFLTTGIFVGESWDVPLTTADPDAVTWPDAAYAFSIYERDDLTDGKNTFTGKERQIGPLYYHPDSHIETLAQVKAQRPGEHVLIQNMEGNGWQAVIWTRWNNWPQPFRAGEATILRKCAASGGKTNG